MFCPSCQTEFDDAELCPACQEPTALQGRYRLVEFLGQGGQGRSYRAINLESGQQVALKELAVNKARDWKAVELFRRSAEVLDRLDHPGLPRHIEDFELQRGKLTFSYIVQELIEGQTLQQRIDERQITDEDDARALLAGLLEILEYLHAQRPPIIHRDIKPANIMQRPDGRLALIDFGLVRDKELMETGSTMMMGTPGFAPIEQFMGQAEPATDIYALGATIVALLTRKDPSTLHSSAVTPLEFRDYVNLSEDFCRLLEEMLQPNPLHRLRSVEEVREVLEGHKLLEAAPGSGAMIPLTSVETALIRRDDASDALRPREGHSLQRTGYGRIAPEVAHTHRNKAPYVLSSLPILGCLLLAIIASEPVLAFAGPFIAFMVYLPFHLMPINAVKVEEDQAVLARDRQMYVGPDSFHINGIKHQKVSLRDWRLETYIYRVFEIDGADYDARIILHLRPMRENEALERLQQMVGRHIDKRVKALIHKKVDGQDQGAAGALIVLRDVICQHLSALHLREHLGLDARLLTETAGLIVFSPRDEILGELSGAIGLFGLELLRCQIKAEPHVPGIDNGMPLYIDPLLREEDSTRLLEA